MKYLATIEYDGLIEAESEDEAKEKVIELCKGGIIVEHECISIEVEEE